jgi:hypothetical protein
MSRGTEVATTRLRGGATPDEQRALAFGQLPGLLALGSGFAESTRRAAEGLPPGDLRSELLASAAAIEGGRPPAEALAAALPEPLRPVLDGPEAALPERIALLGEHLRGELAAAGQARAAAAYPLFVGAGALVVAGVVAGVRLAFGKLIVAVGAPRSAGTLESWLMLAVAAVLVVTSLRALRAGTMPLWARALPGARCFAVRGAQRFAANLALLLDPRVGSRSEVAAAELSAAWLTRPRAGGRGADGRGPEESGRSSLETMLARLGLPDSARFAITLGQLMGDTAGGARRAQAELGREADALSRQYVFAMGLTLMLFAAAAIVIALPGIELLRLMSLVGGP